MQKANYIDLFAGCGGLSLGLYNSNRWKGIFAVEKSPEAFSTLKHNLISSKHHFRWPSWLPRENHEIDGLIEKFQRELVSLRGTVDLVAGGPPCQGFSTAGRRIEGDERNKLVHSYLEFIKAVEPSTIFFENVKGFQVGFKNDDEKRGIPYSEIVLQELQKLGYDDAEARILDFSDYGVPQRRERCIIVATKHGASSAFFDELSRAKGAFLRRKKISEGQTLKMAISDIRRLHGESESPDTKNFMAGCYSKISFSSYQTLMRSGKNGLLPDSHRFANHSYDTAEKFDQIIREKLSSQEIQKRFGTKKTSTKLLEAEEPSPTLTTLPDDYVHYCEPRILTVREYARIQSFPDWFEFKGKYTTGGRARRSEVPRYSQIGNAIPPLFAELAGKTLFHTLFET